MVSTAEWQDDAGAQSVLWRWDRVGGKVVMELEAEQLGMGISLFDTSHHRCASPLATTYCRLRPLPLDR